jgi:L-ascorbate metabolism protein UlaG (beta-lactamase superfamily)
MLVVLALILVGVPLTFVIAGILVSAPRYRGQVSDHFDGKRFITPGGAPLKGLPEVLKWMMTRKRTPWEENRDAQYGKRPLAHYNDGIRITFINHSTFLVQVDGVNILIDPVWSKRTSPYSWIGPKRMRPPGIRFEDLPRIDVVLLTHNHYDHLDLPTMRLVFGAHHPLIITPLGVKAFLDRESIAGGQDLDWWEEVLFKQLKISAVPAQHFSGRGALDRDATLWCGYVITTNFGKIYCAGDTGYNPEIFKQIGERLGPFRISMIPIGAYKPSWFMSPVHTSPEEAVQIHFDVRSQQSIGCHFGTFPLADDGLEDPIDDLNKAKREHNLTEEQFFVLQEGEALVIEGIKTV